MKGQKEKSKIKGGEKEENERKRGGGKRKKERGWGMVSRGRGVWVLRRVGTNTNNDRST